MGVFVADEQADEVIDLEPLVLVVRRILREERQRLDTEVNVLLVGRSEMSELHERFMGESGPTDVLAFPLDEEDETGPGWPPGHLLDSDDLDTPPFLLGDVVVCPSVASEQASRAGSSVADEVRLLVIHGVLHLLGHDHAEPEDAARMQECQAYYLSLPDG